MAPPTLESRMAFEIHVTRRPMQGGVEPAVVRVSGAFDVSSASAAEKVLTPLVATSPKVVVLDLAELRLLDSTGISILLNAKRTIEGKGGSVFITNMQPQIRKVFDIVKALPATAVFKSMKEMDEYLKSVQEKVVDDDA